VPIQKIVGLWLLRPGVLVACAVLAAALGLGASSLPQPTHMSPTPKAGQVDLSQWRFARDGSLPLTGYWLYFDHSWGPKGDAVYAQVPGPWPSFDARSGGTRRNGFGTYVLRLKLPAAPEGDRFALDTGQIYSAYRIIANGRVIAAPGSPGATKAAERAFSYSQLADLPDGARDIEIVMQVSNHLMPHGGVFMAPTVGLRSMLEASRRSTEMLSLIVVGALLFTACYHIAFMRVTRAGYANVWFGVLAALFGVRMFLFEPLASATVPLIGQDWVWRLDFAVTVLLVPTAAWFLALSFPKHIKRMVAALLMSACGALALASLIEGPTVGQYSLQIFEMLGIAVLPYLVQGVVRSALSREHGASLALLGIIVVSIAALHDILLDNIIIAGPNFLPVGCVAFFLCFSGALTQRSHHAFIRSELLVDERTRELELKVAELEQARAAAVSASVAKSRFLANMSHELRTPLNAILGFAEIVRDRMFGVDAGDRYSDYAANIHTSGSHLLGLINDILDLSKIEAGKLDLDIARVDLGEEASAALRLLDPQASKKNVLMALDCPEPVFARADARAVKQILVNLLSNAVKFTPTDGVVSIAIRKIEDRSITITVSDTGIGICTEDMQRVFENFGQGRHDIRARSEAGTGLGLPIVKGLAEAMEGRIDIDSMIDVGTTITITLPPHRALNAVEIEERADPISLLPTVRAFART
jgi:signal transduction histidine kinase